jgi:ribose/xylose/arabinose/galactoside ABC-type transport system permease subunit
MKLFHQTSRWMLELVLVILIVVLAIKAPGFFTADNLLNVLRNVSIQGVIALGMTMVIVAGEIDLGVGSAVAFAGCLLAWQVQALGKHGVAPLLAVTIACVSTLATGALIGAMTGWMRTRFRVPTFIVTLAWFTALRGAAQLITNGFPITPFPDWFSFLGSGYVPFPGWFNPSHWTHSPEWFRDFFGDQFPGIPFPAMLFLLTFAAVHFLMNHTPFGRAVYAVGGNAEAARLSGIRVNRVKIVVMAAVAGLAAFAGILQASQIQSGSASTALGWELDVISAVIIGGASLAGGAGRVWGTLVGLVFLGVLVNGMTLLNTSEYWQSVVRGALILAAVTIHFAPSRRHAA